MRGGGVMRAAAKVAGVGVVNTNVLQVNPSSAEQTVMRFATRSVSSSMSVSSGGGPATHEMTALSDQKSSWEMVDDWEFAGGLDDVASVGSSTSVSGGGERMGRVLFDGVPTMEEAKEATTDLKEALDKVYLSSPSSEDTSLSSHLSLNSYDGETKDCVKANSLPKPAMQAFKLLDESPAVQTVVASLACDPNIWKAVLNNPAYMEFVDSQNNEFEDPGSPLSSESSVNLGEHSDDCRPKDSGSPFLDFLQNIKNSVVDKSNDIKISMVDKSNSIKNSVVEMVNKASNLFQNLFTLPAAESGKENTGSTFNTVDKTIGASLMGLAVMVILVVLVKRA